MPVVASTVTPLPTLNPPALTDNVFAKVDTPATSRPPLISIPPAAVTSLLKVVTPAVILSPPAVTSIPPAVTYTPV